MPEPRYLKCSRSWARPPPARLRSARPCRHGELRSVPADTCGRSVPVAAVVLALSLNSPFGTGAESGALSTPRRPAARAPARRRRRPSWLGRGVGGGGRGERQGLHAQLVGCAAASAARDVRAPDPRPADRVDRTVALVALVQAFCAAPPAAEPLGRDAYLERRAAACAGRRARGEELSRSSSRPRGSSARGSSSSALEPPEALRQLDVGRRGGLEAVVADLVERTAA